MPLDFNQYDLDRGYEGQISNLSDYQHIAGTQEFYRNGETGYLPFGRVVVRSAADDSLVERPSAAGQDVLGIAILNDRFMAESDDPRSTGFPPLHKVPVLKKGHIYMVTETALTRGGPLFFRHTANGAPLANEEVGRVRSDADGANADAFVAGTFRVTEDAAAGEIVKILFDLSFVN